MEDEQKRLEDELKAIELEIDCRVARIEDLIDTMQQKIKECIDILEKGISDE